MPLQPTSTMLTYNELDGSEVAHVLENRFEQIIKNVPYFQRHLTLPRVRITLQVKLEIWADQPNPETQKISECIEVVHDDPRLAAIIEAETVDSAAPGPGGHPPDQIREMHGLPIAQPARGPREVGGQIATSDQYIPGRLDGREVEDLPGLKISRTGTGLIDGMPTSTNATIAKIDQGPAGLRSGRMDRDAWQFGKGKSD
jgi:hypothetical protein